MTLCLAAVSHAPVLFLSIYLLRSFSRLRFLPACVRTLHPFGVLGIYATSSGCCVTFHQPLRDLTVKELVISHDNSITYRVYNVNEKLHGRWEKFLYIVEGIIGRGYIIENRETAVSGHG